MSARVHEASAVACERCGAPLAVDPTASHVWCWTCRVWQRVPDEVLRGVGQRLLALHAAEAEQARQRAYRADVEARARSQRNSGRWMLVLLVVVVAVFLLPALGTVALYGVAAALVAFDELEPWLAGLVVLLCAALVLGVIGSILGFCFFLYRRATRHRRWARLRRDTEWFGHGADQANAFAPVVCGECGAPIAFAPGEHNVTCGFCRAVVLEPEERASALVSIALSEVQRTRMAAAKAERDLFLAKLSAERSSIALRAYWMVGTLALLAVPVLAIGYAFRALTPSLEEALLELARRIDGEFGAGLQPPFEWLDTYWIGTTPPSFEEGGLLSSRWSIASVFHGRPVMTSVLASWTDLGAKRVALVLARPRERDPYRVTATATAQGLRASGWLVHVDYAGVALVARDLRQRDLGVAQLTELARAAFELAEVR